jgi:hypothetical protein
MSMNAHVRFHSGHVGQRGMGRIYHLGVITPEPTIKTEEAIGMAAGAGLFGVGLAVKGKGGMVLSIVGGLAALISGGMAAVRALSAPTPMFTPPPPVPIAPKPAAAPSIPGLPAALAPIIQQLAPIAQKLLTPTPSSPAPSSAMVTSYDQLYQQQPSSGMNIVTSL